VRSMGIGAGLTVCVAVLMARVFLPEVLERSDWILKWELRVLCKVKRCLRKCFCCDADGIAADGIAADGIAADDLEGCASCFYTFATTVLVLYTLAVTAGGVYVFLHFGMERGIGFLPTLPRDTTETNALKSLEKQFGPGPVRPASAAAAVQTCGAGRCSPST
jgi:uncharacterized membrane protein YdfJ with MMPL/SSD domain